MSAHVARPRHLGSSLRWEPGLLPRVSTHIGGVTRILIIDDEGKPATEHPADDEARPEIHEFQIATPVPPDVDSDHGSVTRDDSVVRDLVARVEELLRQTRGLPAGATTGLAGTIRFGSVLLEPSTQTVLRGGQPVRVTHTEFRLLLALMRRRGAIASRIELLREVWGTGAAVSRRAVDTHIARLRRKLEEDPANPRHILTALAWGYRFRP
ncbi:MAG: winged helix-turn-helix domain-containing protein [Gemmatimonadales bacterium]